MIFYNPAPGYDSRCSIASMRLMFVQLWRCKRVGTSRPPTHFEISHTAFATFLFTMVHWTLQMVEWNVIFPFPRKEKWSVIHSKMLICLFCGLKRKNWKNLNQASRQCILEARWCSIKQRRSFIITLIILLMEMRHYGDCDSDKMSFRHMFVFVCVCALCVVWCVFEIDRTALFSSHFI